MVTHAMATFSGGPLHGRALMWPTWQLGFWYGLRVTKWRALGIAAEVLVDAYYARESPTSTRFVLSDGFDPAVSRRFDP